MGHYPRRGTFVVVSGTFRSVHRSGRCVVRELLDSGGNPAPGRRAVVILGCRKLIGAGGAFLEGLIAVALEHQVGRAPDIDLGYHTTTLHACGLRNV
jgi:hypothetical protein